MFSTRSVLTLLSIVSTTLAISSNVTYQISPKSFPSLCLASNSASDGASLIVKDCSSSDTVFTFDGAAFHNTETNLCMDVKDGGWWSGNKMQVWGCFSNNPNQAYEVSGEQIKWQGKGMCLDLTDGNGVSGNKVQIWTCFSNNNNQKWEFVEVEEIDDCSAEETGYLTHSVSVTASPTASVTSSASSTTASSTATNAIGGELLAGGHHANPSSASTTTTYPITSSATGTASVSTSSSSTKKGSSGSTGTTSATTSTSTGTISSGYLQTSGTSVVDSNGNKVVLKGTNLGGWLVLEDWMCGITDNSGNADRFAQETLETRFGASKTATLIAAWQNNFLTSTDFDNLAALGFNALRLPFSWRTLQNADGSWISNRYEKLDWAIAQAKSRGMYVIPTFHIWASQQSSYSQISENTAAGQADRAAAAKIWVDVATHYLGESTIAAYDIINEPTGSYANNLQQDLYNAVRSVDANRIIVMESISTNPSTYGWTNVIYSIHEYLMMTSDYNTNINAYNTGAISDINTWESYNIPVYMGEFMAMGNTLTWMMNQLNKAGIWWTDWTYKTVNMGGWGIYNLPSSAYVDVSSDSYDTILNAWTNNLQNPNINWDIYNVYKNAAAGSTSQRRSTDSGALVEESPRAGQEKEGHWARSRRHTMAHGRKSSF